MSEEIPFNNPEFNNQFEDAELSGGLTLQKITNGESFKLTTKSGAIYILKKENDKFIISGGSRKFLPTEVTINGALPPHGSAIKNGVIWRGMRFEFSHPQKQGETFVTTTVTEIEALEFKK